MYLTINLIDGSIRVFESLEKAFTNAIRINKRHNDSPLFDFYLSNGARKARYLGKLAREFGSDRLYLDEKEGPLLPVALSRVL